MTDLHSILAKLGLSMYLEKFTDEGFETWETVLDITESDLDALGVKLGHRRLLQREIALSKGVSIERQIAFNQPEPGRTPEETKSSGRAGVGAGAKRKYRRHPKPDENAPERPPSAYVIFSNTIREELKPQSLSFTAIAKRVGESWQDLPAEEKEAYESEASSAKERYHTEMAEYKTTKSYREYQQYLADFKAKNSSTSEDKRPKLAQDETATSTSSGSVGSYRTEAGDLVSGTADELAQSIASRSSGGLYSTASALSSPASTKSWPPAIRTGTTGVPLSRVASGTSPTIVSPSIPSTLKFPSHASQTQLGVFGRHAAQIHMESTSPDPGQYPPGDRESGPSLSHASNTGSRDPRSSHSQTSSLEFPRHSGGAPSSLPYNASDSSSKSSVASTWSASSSILPPTALDEPKRTELPLPPLAGLGGGSHTGSLAPGDPVLARQDIEPPAGRSALLKGAQRSPLSSFDSPSKGMKFESLQLPLPYNISFGQRPLSRSKRDIKLANIFDLQAVPGGRKSFKDLTLQQQNDSSLGTNPAEGVPEPRHPPHVPRLPSLPAQPCEEMQNPGLHPNADPLSVLAYAGRLVGRENRGPL